MKVNVNNNKRKNMDKIFGRQSDQNYEFLSYSTDLNLIENLWNYIVRLIYDGGRQFHIINSLKQAISVMWNEIPVSYFQKLVSL